MTISAKIIADSISPQGVRLTTMELEMPRIILPEFNTHRVFSRNAQSSRAVPVSKSLASSITYPLVWGKNKSGMSSDELLDEQSAKECNFYWNSLARYCQDFCERMSKAGLHKQWANRPLEWFSSTKIVVTATEWDNFFWLRDDPEAAQPEIVELARQMKKAMDDSEPQRLKPGQWHLPYIELGVDDNGVVQYYISQPDDPEATYTGFVEIDLETAKKISASACAQISYRKLDTSIEKALEIYERLFSGSRPHLSPVEHIATPMEESGKFAKFGGVDQNLFYDPSTWEPGITHVARDGSFYSGNLRGWIQLRQVI